MLRAWLIRREDKEPVLLYDALNTRRETNHLVLAGKDAGGATVRVFYHFIDRNIKDDSMLHSGAETVKTRLAIAELRKLGSEVQGSSGNEIHINVPGLTPIAVPNFAQLAAAVGDRNGRISNFVAVGEMHVDEATGRMIKVKEHPDGDRAANKQP